MYEELSAPLPDAGAYLTRIGLDGAEVSPTVEWLDKLVHAQLTHVPFDDMDVWGRGDTPSLAINDIFEKIVLRRRGGYCFELNSLFRALLEALGFDAYLVTIRIVAGRDFVTPPSHCGIVCTVGGEKYFCDVGFGGPVPDGCVKYDGQVHRGYRVVRDGHFHCVELVRTDGSAEKVFLYHDIPMPPMDMLPMNFYVSNRPGSVFRNMLNVNLRLPDGGVWLKDRQFSLHSATERFERDIRDEEDLRQVLQQYFGIPDGEAPLRDFGPLI